MPFQAAINYLHNRKLYVTYGICVEYPDERQGNSYGKQRLENL